jgi:signal peptidase I
MSPTITPYSVIVVHKGKYTIGQPIVFKTPNGVVTHRLVSVNVDGSLATKGDAVSTIDPSFEPKANVIGGVELIIRNGVFWVVILIALTGLFYSLYRISLYRLTDTNEVENTAIN